MLLGREFNNFHMHEQPRENTNGPPRRRGMKPTFKGFISWHVAMVCYYLCQSLCTAEGTIQNDILVDLSHEFNNETIYWLQTEPLRVNTTNNGTVPGQGYWFHIEHFSAGTHGGTHLDSPCHFARGRWCTSDIPLSNLVAKAVVIDISNDVKDDSTVNLQPQHLISWEEQHGTIPDGSVVLIRTGWARFWPNRLSYLGTTELDTSLLKHPAVTPEAAQWIVDKRKIVGLGIDTLSVERPRSPVPRTHQILEEQNIYGIENVNDNLKLLPPTGAHVYVMPMKLKGTSGAPCRVLASIPRNAATSAYCKISACDSIVLTVTAILIAVSHSKSP